MDKKINAEEKFSLLNTFALTGNDQDGFREAVTTMAAHTRHEVIDPEDLKFLHVLHGESEDKRQRKEHSIPDDKLVVKVLDQDGLDRFEDEGSPAVAMVASKDFDEEQLSEMLRDTKLALKVGDEKFSVGSSSFMTLLQRADLSGTAALAPTYARNLLLAESIFSSGNAVHLVWREDGSYRKIFAGFGPRYKYIPQTILLDIMDRLDKDGTLGAPTVKEWRVDHYRSMILLEYPEAAEDIQAEYKLPNKVTPGILLEVSDIGLCSITAEVIYKTEGSTAGIAPELLMIKHVGDVTAEEVADNIDQNLLPDIRKLPEALAELIGREVADYSSIDLTTKAGQNDNEAAVKKALSSSVRGKLTTFLGKKRRKSLLEAMNAEINPAKRYTWYDVATAVMELPDRIDGFDKGSVTYTKLQELVGQVPYALTKSAKTITAGDVNDDEDITLV